MSSMELGGAQDAVDGDVIDVDGALEVAADRTREAQERLVEKAQVSAALEPEADIVVHRAEDLRELAVDAAREADATET